jgi:hypothetical protein
MPVKAYQQMGKIQWTLHLSGFVILCLLVVSGNIDCEDYLELKVR